MRLLQYNSNGDLSLIEFLESDIPKYAILSHRWGTEEVTFEDLPDSTSKNKAGYSKIQFCGEQARRDDLQYFWVDTCCIDKSNNTELAEAINSMFRWYQKAARCYVYLSDVSTQKRKASDMSTECTWESAFRDSEWFTRGWTLQELLAPRSVEFFSRDGKRLGDKLTLKRHIQEITGIPISALEGAPLSQFRVEERLSWAKNRQTTRGEDEAYSLLGIFGIYLPLIYGESKEHAFKRLRKEIQDSLTENERMLLDRRSRSFIQDSTSSPSIVPFERNARFTLKGHSTYIKAVAFSPDSKLLVSASGDWTLKLWDACSGAMLKTFEDHSSYVYAVAFSPDGKLLASGSGDKTVKLWDASSGAVQRTLEAHSSSVYAVAFSSDGKLLASGSDKIVKLWDVSSGAMQQTFEDHSSYVYAVAFSPDSKLLASASWDSTIKLWGTQSGTVQMLKGHSSYIYAVAFSPDGNMLASTSEDNTVRLWDVQSGKILRTFHRYSSAGAVAFMPDGKLLALGSKDRTVKLLDIESGAVRQTLEGHSSSVSAVTFSPDGKQLASSSYEVKLWQ